MQKRRTGFYGDNGIIDHGLEYFCNSSKFPQFNHTFRHSSKIYMRMRTWTWERQTDQFHFANGSTTAMWWARACAILHKSWRHVRLKVPSPRKRLHLKFPIVSQTESSAGGGHCVKIAKIDPVSPFYLTFWFKEKSYSAMGKPSRRTKIEP